MPKSPPNLALPRILCLHGGGVTAEVFSLQARSIISALQPHFRLFFADAPFFCGPGPGIVPVYESFGPFRRWLRWTRDEHPPINDDTAAEEIRYAIETATQRDEGTGPVVAVLGFSQGAKLAASLLYEQQLHKERTGKADTDFKFAVLMAGRAPLVALSELSKAQGLPGAGAIAEFREYHQTNQCVVNIPTIHVHGLLDPGLELHRQLLDEHCDPATTTLIEWNGDHRVPIKSEDVGKIVKAMLRTAQETGVLEPDEKIHSEMA